MKTVLTSVDYTDQSRFGLEQKCIFRNAWQFVCLKGDLSRHEDWIVAEFGGVSIIVQNFEGNFVGFINSCSHRFSRIRLAEKGNGRLQCPYHGWCYDSNGLPYAIPSRPRFSDLTAERINNLALAPVRVDCVGAFVFATLANDGPDLRAQLGESVDDLETLSPAIGESLAEFTVDNRANWKLVLENTLEGYHVPWVHKSTFGPLEFGSPTLQTEAGRSSLFLPVGNTALSSVKRLTRFLGPRAIEVEGYWHVYVWPNLAIGTLYGLTIAVQSFVPLAVDKTLLRISLLSGMSVPPGKTAAYEQFCAGAIDLSRRICEEDKSIVEAQQLGVESREQSGILSDEERRIETFQRRYAQALES